MSDLQDAALECHPCQSSSHASSKSVAASSGDPGKAAPVTPTKRPELATRLGLLKSTFNGIKFNDNGFMRILTSSSVLGQLISQPFPPELMRTILDEDGKLTTSAVERALQFVQGCPELPRPDTRVNKGGRPWRFKVTVAEFPKKIVERLGDNGKYSAPSEESWLKRMGISMEDIAALDCVAMPYCDGYHWLLILLFPPSHTITVLDSLQPGGHLKPKTAKIMESMREWAERVYPTHGGWLQQVMQCPRQHNDSDCGVHVVMNAFFVSKGIWPMAHKAFTPRQRRYFVAYMASYGNRISELRGRKLIF